MTGNPAGIFSSAIGGGREICDSRDLRFHLRTERGKETKVACVER